MLFGAAGQNNYVSNRFNSYDMQALVNLIEQSYYPLIPMSAENPAIHLAIMMLRYAVA